LRFGVPSSVTTDRGRQFESALWQRLMELLESKRIRTTSYHPIANSIIERFHCQLQSSIKACNSVNFRTKKQMPTAQIDTEASKTSNLGRPQEDKRVESLLEVAEKIMMMSKLPSMISLISLIKN